MASATECGGAVHTGLIGLIRLHHTHNQKDPAPVNVLPAPLDNPDRNSSQMENRRYLKLLKDPKTFEHADDLCYAEVEASEVLSEPDEARQPLIK